MKQIFLKFADKKTAEIEIKPYVSTHDDCFFSAIDGFAPGIRCFDRNRKEVN